MSALLFVLAPERQRHCSFVVTRYLWVHVAVAETLRSKTPAQDPRGESHPCITTVPPSDGGFTFWKPLPPSRRGFD